MTELADRRPLQHGRDHSLRGSDFVPPGPWIYVGDFPTDPDTTADSPPFENDWANVGGGSQRLRFRLTNERQLEVQGEITGGELGTVVTTLDEDYRPEETQHAVGATDSSAPGSAGSVAVWRLDPDGSLTMVGGATLVGVPDPSFEADGRVLQTFGGAAIWTGTLDGNQVAIQFHRDTAAGFTSDDPVLADGELGYETDTGLFKVGDGVTAWTSLGYSGGSPTGAAGGALDGSYPNPGLASSVAGAGLAEASDVLSVNVDGSTIEISSDALRVKDDGITAAKIAAGAVGASELASSGVTAATYGDASHVPQIAVDVDGRITSAVDVAVSGGAPSGAAGGALDGTYPNPGLAAAVAGAGLAETSDVLSVNVDDTTIEINADTLRVKAGGIGANELASTAVAAGTYGDASHVVQIVVDADGRITGATAVAITGGATPANADTIYGDGSDGAAAFDGTNTFAFASTTGAAPNLVYTLTRDIYVTSLTVSSGKTLITGSYRIFCTGTLTNAGTIHNDGNAAAGTVAGQGATQGVLPRGANGATGLTSGTTTTAGGGGGGAGASNMVCVGSGGGAGGNSNGGPSGGTTNGTGWGDWREVGALLTLQLMKGSSSATTGGSAATMGAAGGGGSGGRTTGGTATASGAGGGGAGVVCILAKTIDNSAGTIRANGGNGSNATGGTCATGGGGGGGGGGVILVYQTLTAGTEQALGGTKGTGLNGAAAAADGSTGRVIKIAAV